MFFTTLFRDPAYFINAVVIVIVSITIHELFHALAAVSQGDDTPQRAGRLTLNPLAHMEPASIVLLVIMGLAWGQTPVNPSKFKYPFSDALVSFAGPFANLLLMTLSIWLGLWLHQMPNPGPWGEASIDFLSLAALLNGFLFLLNMLPIPPLDGFHILETFVPPLRRYSVSLGQYGIFILLVLFWLLGLGRILFAIAQWMVLQISAFSTGILSTL